MRSHFLFPILLAGFIFAGFSARAGEPPTLPGSGYAATRYEALWSKSPFSVASAEDEGGPSSPDYSLVGIAQFDGVSYASLVNKQTQEHFLVASDKPNEGFTLTSVTRGHDPSGTLAVLQKDGQSMTLKLETAPVAGGPTVPPMLGINGGIPPPPGMNGGMANMPPMPGSQFNQQQPGVPQPPMPWRRGGRIIRIPPPPGEMFSGQTGTAQPVQPQPVAQPPVQSGQPPPAQPSTGQPNPVPVPAP
jgi:hypothetical protein